ncbi:Protein of unknown function [Nitrosospira briensis]|uniref:DUF3644 domain-containing protein n=1 Tax=Nitrosospira briensis TaxID=35799 RepID=A0A1I5B3B1_9PROT|nr:DUF3644 domain-containing protein [Nitrosospira briensis]SFN69206.1 Protein of unknown function [Nitrosospira briensis]
MSTAKRVRRIFSIKEELLKKSREAALAAVQIFNNPNVTFKSETYIVLMNIAWTYLLHAYYRAEQVDYRYFIQGIKRKQYSRTKNGAFKHWELERCLNEGQCPLEREVVQNLKFLIGLRHEIEHQMTTRIDDLLSARFQACCINYHDAAASLFGEEYGIAKHLAVSLQFSSLSQEQVDTLEQQEGLPRHIKQYIEGFDGALAPDEFGSAKFAYRVIFVPKTTNHPNQADQVITFIKADSELAKGINATYSVIRETERPKWLPTQIVTKIKMDGFPKFGMAQHTDLWKSCEAKNPAKGFGVQVAKTWYWYDSWLAYVRKYCTDNSGTNQ